ncbi:TPA: exosporium leader peptide-containing protein [Bacillus cereus]|uniref:Exosporium leader peptide n=2 Tax=Bacillales TaxID=1385 RepID=A0A1D3NEA2_BACCE|nr:MULTISPECIES: exosporium leader peptide-containing protein [Bacillus]MCU5463153.1 exosporium leader peptide-containing protein [Bacillus cereus]MCU5751935.1 exosporium leader peptide-containing protein [Bacillus cereus]MDA1633799.1 exosporium leader peptide-containing protein [Bacillus cereus]PFE15590.1 hypothetical protein CN307_10820 [Bacillus cereus]SCM96369.1 Protein of unknown function [Bacillus cereus]
MNEFLSSVALNPSLIGPTLPPIPPFTLPTGSTGFTGPTGAVGATGPTEVPSSTIFVANRNSNNVSVINTNTNSVIATIPVGLYPFGIDVLID